ncbi:MAG TPA: hypothetical protein VED63_12370, partial [Acidimicrobiales bacterium]|nr:hypothetical protein [Acidimicrobiales bacterium]
WAEMRREGALEDLNNGNAMLIKGLAGKATVQQVFDYYLGWLADPSISPHYVPLSASQFSFVDEWGLATAMGDLNNVIKLARDGGKRTVILGGHSLGGAEASIYPVWDFSGKGGYTNIAGIIGIDGDAGLASGFGGSPPLTTAAEATSALTTLEAGSPWLDLLGNGLPWITGPYAEVGALAALMEPNDASILQQFPLLPPELKTPVQVTNQAGLGYAFDASTSPASLALIHVHSGHVATTGSAPFGWVNDGPTPVQDIAFAFSQEPLGPVDWYYPERLTIDTEAAGSLTETPAATVLGLSLDHLSQVDVPMYVIQTSLGGTNNAVIDAAEAYKAASKIPTLMTVNEASTYAHLDPLLATPAQNDFLTGSTSVIPWIEKLPGYQATPASAVTGRGRRAGHRG